MPRSIVTTITISDDDPPAVTITVHADGNALVGGAPLAPQDAAKLIRTIGQATNDPDVEPALQEMVAPVVVRLREVVRDSDARQTKRKDALAAWESVVASSPTDPTKPPNPNKP